MKIITLLTACMLLFFGCSAAPLQNEVLVEGNKNVSDFYIQKFNTTVEEYNVFLEETGVSTNYNDDTWQYCDRPLRDIITSEKCAVANVSFIEVIQYANWLSEKNGLKKAYKISEDGSIEQEKKSNGYRVPTCDEWEWAAHGGVLSAGFKYPGSDVLDDVAWYRENSGNVIHEPGLKKGNELGIYDMYGNVGEWCWDEYLSIPDVIVLEGEDRTDPKDWMRIASEFRATTKHKWNRISLKEIEERKIEVDERFIKKYKGRATFYTPFWKSENEFLYRYPIDEDSPSYMGIRLVRNAR